VARIGGLLVFLAVLAAPVMNAGAYKKAAVYADMLVNACYPWNPRNSTPNSQAIATVLHYFKEAFKPSYSGGVPICNLGSESQRLFWRHNKPTPEHSGPSSIIYLAVEQQSKTLQQATNWQTGLKG